MKNLLFVLLITLTFSGCESIKKDHENAKKRSTPQGAAGEIVNGIMYIKDPQTNICFAYYWGGAMNGGPALATCPCDSIPKNLLIIANVK